MSYLPTFAVLVLADYWFFVFSRRKVLSIQIFLRINRLDLASQKLKELKTTGAEDHTLTRLAGAWILITEGDKAKMQDAALAYEELIDKYSKLSILYTDQMRELLASVIP